MINLGKMGRIEKVLIENGVQELSNYLPSPLFVQEVISLVNRGKSDRAAALVNESERILLLFHDCFEIEDRLWLEDIILCLKNSIKSSNS